MLSLSFFFFFPKREPKNPSFFSGVLSADGEIGVVCTREVVGESGGVVVTAGREANGLGGAMGGAGEVE